MAAPKDIKVLLPDGKTWRSIVGRPGKDAGITKADFDKLDGRLKQAEATIAQLKQQLDALPTYDKGPGIDIK